MCSNYVWRGAGEGETKAIERLGRTMDARLVLHCYIYNINLIKAMSVFILMDSSACLVKPLC